MYKILCGHVFISLGYIPRSGISGSCDKYMFKFLRNFQAVFHSVAPFYIPTSNVWGFQFLHIFANTCCCPSFLITAILLGVTRHFILFLICIFLVLFCFGLHHTACGILVPQPGIEPGPSAVRARSLNHWTARELLSPLISFFFKINKFTYLFIYFWLRWVFVAAHGLSLVVASGGYYSLQCMSFSLWWLLLLWSMGSRHVGLVVVACGLSSCGSWALERRFSSCGTWA